MLTGAIFWGFGSDIIGRKYAFNLSLLVSTVFCIAAGAAPNWIVLGLFVSLAAFGAGGNLVLDTAIFLEYLPGQHQWLVTLMAAWWGLGQLVAGLFAWAFLPNFSCPGDPVGDATTPGTGVPCNWDNNRGWRYVWFANGALVLAMSIARLTLIRLKETPKFLIGEGKDAEVVETLQFIAKKYDRTCSLALEDLETISTRTHGGNGLVTGHAQNKFSPAEIVMHLRGLFATRKLGRSTLLVWLSWLLIGLAYPLYHVFLPSYIATRGAALGGLSVSDRWRNYALSNMCSIPSPILAGFMCRSRFFWGRRGTMVSTSNHQDQLVRVTTIEGS
jgi:MFS family permease